LFFGEVGLSGEIRPVNRVNQRIQEAEKLGFSTILFLNTIKLPKNTGIQIRLVAKIEDVVSELLIFKIPIPFMVHKLKSLGKCKHNFRRLVQRLQYALQV
jgi:hypothetical protein